MSQRTIVLGVTLGVTVVMALVDTLLPASAADQGAIDLLASVGFALCAFAWVKADARERQIEPPRGSALLAALIIPIGLPVYLFRARGARRGFVATLKAFGFMLLVAVTYVAIVYVVELFTHREGFDTGVVAKIDLSILGR